MRGARDAGAPPGERWRRALDPLALHVAETLVGRRGPGAALSFGESLEGARDILLVGARDLVDLLAIAPAARALRRRFRLARVHVIAAPRCAEVLASRPETFGTVPWPEGPILSRGFLRTVRELRRHACDLAVATDAGEDRRGRLLAALSGAKLRAGVHPEAKDPALNLVVATGASGGYRPAQSLEFLSFLGIPREDLAPGWEVPEVDRQYAARLLELRRRGREGWLLGVDPGRGLGGVRPSPEKLAWLVDRLAAVRGAVPIILTGDRSDASVDDFKKYLKTPPLEVAQRGLRDAFSFLCCCDLFLAGNTELLHFAVALRVPLLAFLPPDGPERWMPAETAWRRVLRWRPGERVLEGDFLRTADAVRRAGAEVRRRDVRSGQETPPMFARPDSRAITIRPAEPTNLD
jgi:ADP-heptose:LPS heptosyltransferase